MADPKTPGAMNEGTKRVAEALLGFSPVVPNGKFSAVAFCQQDSRTNVIVLLPRRKFALLEDARSVRTLNGVVGGFSTSALRAASGLCAARQITQEDEQAFRDWWCTESSSREESYKLAAAREVAERHGYKLVKKKGSS